ncbi:MAG: hypothetical protein IIY70_00055 [Oscillospiraceae bacterium]|nr:hypothetical protein [Oscillospiraceae bacterium]
MKKTILLLSALALVLIILSVGLLGGLFSQLRSEQSDAPDLEGYLSNNWSVFQLRSWEPASGRLELDYPLPFTLEQMKKYGGRLEELRALPEGNRSTLADLKLSLEQYFPGIVRQITLYGMTTDGEIAYTLAPDGKLACCWDE